MSAEERMEILDGMFTELENLKIQAGEQCRALGTILKQCNEVYKANSAEGLKDVFGNMKSFLDSGNNTMMQINNDLKVIASDLAKLQQVLQ